MNVKFGKSKIDIIQQSAINKVILIAIPRLILSSSLFIIYTEKIEVKRRFLVASGVLFPTPFVVDAVIEKNIYQLYFSFIVSFVTIISIILNIVIGTAFELLPVNLTYLFTEIFNVYVLFSITKDFNERYKWYYYKKIGANVTIQSKCYKYLTNLRCF